MSFIFAVFLAHPPSICALDKVAPPLGDGDAARFSHLSEVGPAARKTCVAMLSARFKRKSMIRRR